MFLLTQWVANWVTANLHKRATYLNFAMIVYDNINNLLPSTMYMCKHTLNHFVILNLHVSAHAAY